MNSFWNMFFFCEGMRIIIKDLTTPVESVSKPHMKKKKLMELERKKKKQDRIIIIVSGIILSILIIALILISKFYK